jgi:hypothetical protein
VGTDVEVVWAVGLLVGKGLGVLVLHEASRSARHIRTVIRIFGIRVDPELSSGGFAAQNCRKNWAAIV